MNTRFLALWDCMTGKPETEKPEDFKVNEGDWFALKNWNAEGVKYKPYGVNIDRKVETLNVGGNVGKCIYMWDGNEWNLTLPEEPLTITYEEDDQVNVRLNYYELDILLDALVSLGGHRDLYDKLFMAHDEAWKVRK